jgi:hypothetical protein
LSAAESERLRSLAASTEPLFAAAA